MTDRDLRKHSSIVTDGVEQAPSRAMLRAVGFTDEDFAKPQVGIASTWSMVTPCNMHIDKLAETANRASDAAGGKGVIYNVITVSDGISMGTEGMKYSLVSREVIADSVETVSGCMGHDGIIGIGGCDKNMPGLVMGMARLNRPSIFVYGGTIQPGPGRTDVVSVFEAVGGHAAGKVSDIELKQIEDTAHTRPGLLRRHVYRQHHGLRHRGPRHEPAQQFRPGCDLGCEAERLRTGRGGDHESDRKGHQAFRHHDPGRLRERHQGRDRARRLDQCGAASARHGPYHRRQARTRRFQPHRPRSAGAGRLAPERQLPDVGTDRHRRHPAADEAHAHCRNARRFHA